ncbi:hypothetical protein KI688_002596 [Linnemannia hyalina]|uniref:Uncharacterized protein n=1 Tax=Linnemannia hyalina TaxID=64524 RepID=A0A9P8BRI0_9FUNG|nr:hypothetical protein KI688_002596 [Linnemannia hyalina]
MTLGIVLLGLIAALNADCISATLTWTAQDGYQKEIWLEVPNHYNGHVGKHRYTYLGIDSDDKAFRVFHFDGPQDERMLFVYKGKSYSRETKDDGSASGDKFTYNYYYCLDGPNHDVDGEYTNQFKLYVDGLDTGDLKADSIRLESSCHEHRDWCITHDDPDKEDSVLYLWYKGYIYGDTLRSQRCDSQGWAWCMLYTNFTNPR